MEKVIEIESEFNELMAPNLVGIPCKNENSEELRKEHKRWKKEIEKNRCKKLSQFHYWEKKSVCTAL
jgi:hypothetical protein